MLQQEIQSYTEVKKTKTGYKAILVFESFPTESMAENMSDVMHQAVYDYLRNQGLTARKIIPN